MKLLFVAAYAALSASADALRSDKVLMSQLNTLTLRDGQMTRGRRMDPIPQLQCVGGDAQGLYAIDVIRCINLGSDYGDEDSISWKCTADVPKYFKLGSTDVICEGYSGPDDPYILKGSCGVEYRLGLTDEGYERYNGGYKKGGHSNERTGWWPTMFTIIFWCVVCWIVYSAYSQRGNNVPRAPEAGGNGRPWFGGGDDDAPPPYSPPPYTFKRTTLGDQTAQQGWQPGFWTGLAAGTAGTAGVNMLRGSRSNPGRERDRFRRSSPSGGPGNAESSTMGAARHESSGFGQSRRR